MMLRKCIGFFIVSVSAVLLFPAPGRGASNPENPYARIDSYALAAPKSATASPDALAAYLIRPARNDREKARAIYRWICENISYDTDAFLNRAQIDCSVEGMLRHRIGVCQGYATLFEYLAKKAGLEVVTITGFSKGYGFQTGDRVSGEPNHAWNAVKIDGKWQLIDSTWGSGHVNEQQQFEREFNEGFFLMPPEYFIYDHFPTERMWQLLPAPVTRAQYENLARTKPTFFAFGLRTDSHPQSVISANDAVTVTLGAPEDVCLTANLYRLSSSNGRAGVGPGALGSEEREMPETLTLVQREAGKVTVRAQFPTAGAYLLRVFARRRDEVETPEHTDRYVSVLEYRVDARSGREGAGFPYVFASFSRLGASVQSPLSGALPAGKQIAFQLDVPGVERVMVGSGGKMTPLSRSGTSFSGDVPISRGEVVVCGFQKDNPRRGAVLLKYRAE